MAEAQPSVASPHAKGDIEKDLDAAVDEVGRDAKSDEESIDTQAQAGVQKVEAIATVWSKTSLVTAYVLIWIVYFIMLMQQGTTTALVPYVTSAFAAHSLTATVSVLSSIIGGACNLTVAKILDVFGRPQGYGVSLIIATVGLVMMAATKTVKMYAAAQVFWTVGNNALLYSVNIFVADTTGLRNRALMTALTSSPNIVTTWLGGPIAEAFLGGPGWRWAFGAFSIVVPAMCLPLYGLLMFNYSKAKKQGVIKLEKSSRSPWQSFLYYCREFDAIGLLLITAGICLFLLPFNIYTMQAEGWKSPLIICLLVFGVVLMVLFALWEKFFAPVTFIPYELLLDRNMVGGCALGAVLFISYYCWFSFFSSFLQVVNGLSVTKASYVVQIYSLGGSLFAIATGVAITYTGRFKGITLYVAIPLYALFMGLMIHFREPSMNVGYIIMCQIFISIASGVIVITPAIAAVSVSSHQNIAVVMAIVSMFSSVGGAIGLTIASAIWQGIFPKKLLEYLPVADQANLLTIYASIDVQLSYPEGSETRTAIQHAYSDAQSMMLAAGTAIWVVGFAATAFWRDINVKNIKQVKGQVI